MIHDCLLMWDEDVFVVNWFIFVEGAASHNIK